MPQVKPRPELRERLLAAARSAPASQPPTISQAKTALTRGTWPLWAAAAAAVVAIASVAALISARDLPPLPPNRVYQLWAVAGDAPTSIGLFTTDATGRGRLVVDFPCLSGPLAALAVTVEPQGGVPSPTGPKYLVGTLAD